MEDRRKERDDERPVDIFGDVEGTPANTVREHRRATDDRVRAIMDEAGIHKRTPADEE